MTSDPEFPTTNPPVQGTIYLNRPDGRIAYEMVGQGPLVVLLPRHG